MTSFFLFKKKLILGYIFLNISQNQNFRSNLKQAKLKVRKFPADLDFKFPFTLKLQEFDLGEQNAQFTNIAQEKNSYF